MLLFVPLKGILPTEKAIVEIELLFLNLTTYHSVCIWVLILFCQILTDKSNVGGKYGVLIDSNVFFLNVNWLSDIFQNYKL